MPWEVFNLLSWVAVIFEGLWTDTCSNFEMLVECYEAISAVKHKGTRSEVSLQRRVFASIRDGSDIAVMYKEAYAKGKSLKFQFVCTELPLRYTTCKTIRDSSELGQFYELR